LQLPDATSFISYENTLLTDGFCLIPKVLNESDCQQFIAQYKNEQLYRSTIEMKHYNFGSGQYRYFTAPLPEAIMQLRLSFYELLSKAANNWARRAKINMIYPVTHSEFEEYQRRENQTKSTPLILRYTKGDYNCLHQDISGEVYFPYQIIFVLSQQRKDFEGGEIILTQQRPRRQMIPHIIKPNKGDCLIISSNYHPCQGARGTYRTTFRHGVGKITDGERYSLGIIFHNYAG